MGLLRALTLPALFAEWNERKRPDHWPGVMGHTPRQASMPCTTFP